MSAKRPSPSGKAGGHPHQPPSKRTREVIDLTSEQSDQASESINPERSGFGSLQRNPQANLRLFPSIYRKLDHAREIRIIRLYQGGTTNDLRCILTHELLDNIQPFEALSYVWGSAERTKDVLVNDEIKLSITENLHSALSDLSASGERRIWVDAICIDQSNVSERNAQVALMGEIYSKAQEVLIYLGSTQEFRVPSYTKRRRSTVLYSPGLHKELLLFLHMLAADRHLVDITTEHRSLNQSNISHTLSDEWSGALSAMDKIHGSPWWTRIWTVQELILSSSALFVIGPYAIPWHLFSSAVDKLDQHINSCCRAVDDPRAKSLNAKSDAVYSCVVSSEHHQCVLCIRS